MKKITLLLGLFFFAITSYGQVQVGTGTNTSQGFPIDPYYYYSYSQSIYLASEINAAGTITSIQWYYSGTSNLPNSQDLVIYLGHTSKTAFASGTDWEAIGNLTAVYTGSIGVDGPGWVTFELDEPFIYNGTDNLIVAATELQDDYDEDEDAFYNTAVTTYRSLGYISDDETPNLEEPGDAMYFEKFVPNVIFGGLTQACPTPLNVVATTVTTTTATIEWQNPDEGTTFPYVEYYVSQTAVPPVADTFPSGNSTTGETTLTITENLSASSTYYVWVRNTCGQTSGGWSMAATFTTACPPVDIFYEDFDATAYEELPGCWTAIIRGEGISEYAFIGTVDYNALSGDNSVEISNDESAGTAEFILASPNLGNLGAGTHRLKFSAIGYGPLQVGTLSSSTATAVFTSLEDIAITDEYAEFVVDFTAYDGEDTYIGFRLNPSDVYESVNLDNIRWELSPACADVTAFSFTGASTDSASFTWEPGESETQWDIVVGPSTATTPDGLIPFSPAPAEPSVTVTGLTDNTSYKAWVRSVCGTDENGAWIGPILFNTACNPASTISENFDTTDEGTLPNCWSSIKRGTGLSSFASILNSDYESDSGDYSIRIYTSTTNTTTSDLILVSPLLTNVGAGTHQLKFSALVEDLGDSEDIAIEIVTLNDNTTDAEFTVLETIPLTEDFEEHTIDFSGYNGTDSYIGFRLTTTDTYTAAYIDNVSWEPTLSNGQFENAGFKFYPNPVRDVLNISYNQDISKIEVYNVLGQKVIENEMNTNAAAIDMSSLPNGSYLVKVTSGDQTRTIKAIKQ